MCRNQPPGGRVLVVERPGSSMTAAAAATTPGVALVPWRGPDISSTRIRGLLRAGSWDEAGKLVPPAVLAYLRTHPALLEML